MCMTTGERNYRGSRESTLNNGVALFDRSALCACVPGRAGNYKTKQKIQRKPFHERKENLEKLENWTRLKNKILICKI